MKVYLVVMERHDEKEVVEVRSYYRASDIKKVWSHVSSEFFHSNEHTDYTDGYGHEIISITRVLEACGEVR